MIEKQTVFKECVFSTPSFQSGLSLEQIEQALIKELHGNQAVGYFVAQRKVSIDHKIGGNPEDVSNWEKTISQNPALLKTNRFKSWVEMVSNPKIKANLQKAILKRVETMKQKQITQLQQIMKDRIENKKATFIIVNLGDFYVFQPLNLRNQSDCFEGQDIGQAKNFCLVSNFYNPAYVLVYERDNQGRFRVRYTNEQVVHTNKELYSLWTETGCSTIPQNYDFRKPIPQYRFMGLCSDCVPTAYNSPQGFFPQCHCPAF